MNALAAWTASWGRALRELLAADALPPRTQRVVLVTLLLLTVLVRWQAIDVPSLDRTHWKEIDYLALSTNYWMHGYHFLKPEITWPAEPPRVTAMELPLVPFLAGLGYGIAGYHAWSARLVTLAAFLVLAGYLFLLARRELGPVIGLLSAAAVSLLPLHSPFSRMLYSEPLMLAMSVAGLHHWACWLDSGRKRDWWLGVLGFSLAVALKAEPLYLLLPLGWLAIRRHGLRPAAGRPLLAFVARALALPVAWYAYAYHLARTSIDVFGVFGGVGEGGGHDKFQTFAMLSDPAWYRTIAGRVGYGVLGGKVGVVLAAAGLAAVVALRRGGLIVAYLAAILAYFAIVAEGNLDAAYRQLHILPPAGMCVALGSAAVGVALVTAARRLRSLVTASPRLAPGIVLLVGLGLVVLTPVRRRTEILRGDPAVPVDAARWELAQVIRAHHTPGGRLVAAGEYTIHVGGSDLSPVLYHYAGIQGWTLRSDQWTLASVDSLIGRGATLFAAVRMSREPAAGPFLRQLRARHPVLFEDGAADLLLLELR